jgi:hypothetical protein
MAQERPNRLAEWLLLFRRQTPIVRERFAQWLAEVRQEPGLVWDTSAVRYTVYVLVGLILLAGARCGVRMITPPPPASAKAPALTADFHVLCSDGGCGVHFVINRKFEFSGFPVDCPRCKKTTGERAVKCYSPGCRGKWVTVDDSSGRAKCSQCGGALEK